MATKKFNIVLHIGTEKTGSSAIQNLLHQNSALLNDSGVVYLCSQDRIDARTLAAAAFGDTGVDDYLMRNSLDTPEQRQLFRQNVAEHFVNSLNSISGNVHTVIISSEHFQSRLRNATQLQWIKSLLEPYANTFNVVVYLRSQIKMAESFYSTQLKNAAIATLEETVLRGCRYDNFYYNHKRLLDLWAGVFGQPAITPRAFESNKLKNGDVVEDFIAAASLSIAYQDLNIKQLRFNESILPLGQHLLRLLNQSTDRSSFTELKLKLIEVFAGKGECLSVELAEKVQSDFRESNQQVAQQWFGQSNLFSSQVIGSSPVQISALEKSQLDVVSEALCLIEPREGVAIQSLDHFADFFRDIALELEATDLQAAVAHMELAWRIRPSGPVINRKLGEYSLLVKRWPQRLRAILTRKPCE